MPEYFRDEKNIIPLPGIEPRIFKHVVLVTIPTARFWFSNHEERKRCDTKKFSDTFYNYFANIRCIDTDLVALNKITLQSK